jgi:hypothetical protein
MWECESSFRGETVSARVEKAGVQAEQPRVSKLLQGASDPEHTVNIAPRELDKGGHSTPELIDQIFARLTCGDGPGVNVLIRRVYAELYGAEPSGVVFKKIADEFEIAWDQRFSPPVDPRLEKWLPPIGAGSPYYVKEGELSPHQENAIRILEDG